MKSSNIDTKHTNMLHDYMLIEEAAEMINSKGFSAATLDEFGLYFVNANDKCKTDLLWERIALPIHGFSGRVIAHAGRKLESRLPEISKAMTSKYMSQELAEAKINKWIKSKWINEPYEKSKNLFNMHRAHGSILDLNYCIVVEGYWDVMALYNKGIYNVVAACGTNLSKYHAYFIKALCDHCVFIYDTDDAGEKASDRSVEMMDSVGIFSTVIELPDGLDPDEYVRHKKSKSLIRTMDSIISDKTTRVSLT